MAETGIIQKLRRARNLFILRTLPPCKDIVKIVSASLDRKLTIRERAVMRLHLLACKPCVRYMEQSHFLSSAASQLDDNLKDDLFTGRLSDEARDRIKNALKASTGLFALVLATL
ncbi:MAG: zf-HC2 domain-containing protein [Acidobacteriota bacterium]